MLMTSSNRAAIGLMLILSVEVNAADAAPPTDEPQVVAQKTLAPLCLQISRVCISRSAEAGAPASTLQLQIQPERMQDLSGQINAEAKASAENESIDELIDRIEVYGRPFDPNAPPDIPPGFGAMYWAGQHPSQWWRIFLPYLPTQGE